MRIETLTSSSVLWVNFSLELPIATDFQNEKILLMHQFYNFLRKRGSQWSTSIQT